MSKIIHYQTGKHFVACNMVVNPLPRRATYMVSEVTCKTCLKVLAKQRAMDLARGILK